MQKVRKCVIPVAGMGTRFLPATKAIPKEMLPIIDKPTIQYIVEEAVASGITDILFITSSYKTSIIDHFDRSFELEQRLQKAGKNEKLDMVRKIPDIANFTFIRQGEPNGSGHAIKKAKDFVAGEPFAVMYGDDLMMYDHEPVLKQLIDIYDKTGANVIGVQQVDPKLTYKYGIVDYDDKESGKIKSIIEKPLVNEAPSNDAGLGRYIVNPSIFDELYHLERGAGNEYQFTDAMLALMKKEPFYACRFDGKYFDIGNQLGYLEANVAFAERRDDLKEDFTKFLDKDYKDRHKVLTLK